MTWYTILLLWITHVRTCQNNPSLFRSFFRGQKRLTCSIAVDAFIGALGGNKWPASSQEYLLKAQSTIVFLIFIKSSFPSMWTHEVWWVYGRRAIMDRVKRGIINTTCNTLKRFKVKAANNLTMLFDCKQSNKAWVRVLYTMAYRCLQLVDT